MRRLFSDPLDPDCDDDGDELADGTDPQSPDSDSDGSAAAAAADPHDDLKAKLVGPLGGVDPAARVVTMFGCLTIDAGTASLDGFSLADLAPGELAPRAELRAAVGPHLPAALCAVANVG